MGYFVYILYSESLDSFYKGQTSDLNDRLKRHNLKQEKSTAKGAPWKLIWTSEKSTRGEALKLERKIKNLTRVRLLDFIMKNREGVAGPDVLTIIVRSQGADNLTLRRRRKSGSSAFESRLPLK